MMPQVAHLHGGRPFGYGHSVRSEQWTDEHPDVEVWMFTSRRFQYSSVFKCQKCLGRAQYQVVHVALLAGLIYFCDVLCM